MPRYFFDLRNGKHLEHDEDGLEMPDLDTAYLEAFEAAREMWIDAIRTGGDNPSQKQFEISNAERNTLLVVPFMEILESLKGVPRPSPTASSSKLTPAERTDFPKIMRARQIVDQQTERVQRIKAQGRDAGTAELLLDVFVRSLRVLEEKYYQIEQNQTSRVPRDGGSAP